MAITLEQAKTMKEDIEFELTVNRDRLMKIVELIRVLTPAASAEEIAEKEAAVLGDQ